MRDPGRFVDGHGPEGAREVLAALGPPPPLPHEVRARTGQRAIELRRHGVRSRPTPHLWFAAGVLASAAVCLLVVWAAGSTAEEPATALVPEVASGTTPRVTAGAPASSQPAPAPTAPAPPDHAEPAGPSSEPPAPTRAQERAVRSRPASQGPARPAAELLDPWSSPTAPVSPVEPEAPGAASPSSPARPAASMTLDPWVGATGRGHVAVSSVPAARVSIDGTELGWTPLVHALPAGTHRVTLEAEGHRSATVQVTVEAGGRSTVARRLEPVDAAHGTLRVTSVPWSRVLVDGRDLGPTPVIGVRLPAGRHQVTLRAADGREVTRSVVIEAGRASRLVVRFDD